MTMTDFQDAFITLFWQPLAIGLGIYTGGMIVGAVLHVLLNSIYPYVRRARSTSFGQDFTE
jgi:hypothetical protein